ncbi:AfsR/SARP family transcriptional regulator [Streptomyces sp. CoH27]|uniref:AfsR/SARP family transcriptional regulator n=1 Tax=Streptomyces sp. CoH27 TaxID=2875763 RepID=UPI001CD5E238|nr:AfsR/SARP family transcriptional regulator [Streptomyces sp. CoH27]
MRYQVLGPLQVIDRGVVRQISAPKMENVLATLLARGNQVVSVPQLTLEIWGENPPRRATSAIHVYISQLRKLLCGATSDECPRPVGPIVTSTSGYLLQVKPDDLDCRVFQRLVQRGRAELTARRFTAASATLSGALDLWRGSAFGRLGNGPIVTGFSDWLEELRLECIEMQIEAELALGHHRELVGRLYRLISEYSLHEVFYAQLMRALFASDRRADALAVYAQAADVLRSELGLEPGLRLRELQRVVLIADSRHRVALAPAV